MGIKAENYVDSCLSNPANLRDLIMRAIRAHYPNAAVRADKYYITLGCLHFSTYENGARIELIGELDIYPYDPSQPWAQSIVPALRRALMDMHEFASAHEQRRAIAREADIETLVRTVNAMEFTYARDAEAKP